MGIARASWLYPAFPTIWSYLEAPRSLDELQEDLSAKAGYDVHHICRTKLGRGRWLSDKKDRQGRQFGSASAKHWEINAWYQTRNLDFSDVAPREYLRGKDWDERRKVGLDVLAKFGVH